MEMDTTTEYLRGLHNETMGVNINDTIDVNSSGTKASFLIYDYLIPTIGTVIILANLAVVISSGLILKKGQQPRSTYLFLGNVAMTDLVTGVAVVFGQTFPKEKRDHYLCAVQIGMIVSSTLTSIYSVGLIAVDRFLYILHGMKYQTWVYPTRARLLICISWMIGLIIGFMPLLGWYGDTDNGSICWFILLAPKGLVLLTVLLGCIPIIVVILLYSIILYHALKKIMQIQRTTGRNDVNTENDPSSGKIRMFRGGPTKSESDLDEQPQQEKKGMLRFFKKKPSATVKAPNKWKAIKVVLFTSGSFILTWSPYFIISTIYVFNCDIENTSKKCKTMRSLIASPLAILGFMNSLLNPIIYAWWHKGFRSFVKKKVNTMLMRNKNKKDISVPNSKTTTSRSTSLTEKTFKTSKSECSSTSG